MAPNDQKTEVVPPEEVPEDLTLPSDPKVIFLGGLFVLAVLAAAYVVSEIVLPLVFAIVLKLLLQPALRALERLHVPRIVAALLLIFALFGAIVGLGTAISGPARTWAAKLPEGIPRLEERLSFLRAPINTVQLFLQQVEDFGETGPPPNGAISERGASLLMKLFTGTRYFASGFFTTVLFLFFLLVSGDIFLHRLVEILPLLPAGLYFGFQLIEGDDQSVPLLLASIPGGGRDDAKSATTPFNKLCDQWRLAHTIE